LYTKRLKISGGGPNLLAPLIEERIAAIERAPTSYLIIPPAWASLLNSVGMLLSVLYAPRRTAANALVQH